MARLGYIAVRQTPEIRAAVEREMRRLREARVPRVTQQMAVEAIVLQHAAREADRDGEP